MDKKINKPKQNQQIGISKDLKQVLDNPSLTLKKTITPGKTWKKG
jgi:hypothetical protein